MPLPKIRSCLFDMDGLLIDSEDIYTICTNKVLAELGKPNLPWSVKAKLQGLPGPEAGRVFREWAKLGPEVDLESKMKVWQRELFPTTRPLPGVENLLRKLASREGTTKIPLALATSSHRANFWLKTDHLQKLFAVFPEENRVMGDDPRIPINRGKPAPDIYLLALKTINDAFPPDGSVQSIQPSECLVFEDSVPGVEAGRRAGCQVVWCPHPELLREFRGREKQVLAGQTGQFRDKVGLEAHLKNTGVPDKPEQADDEYAILLETLEDFPFSKYGLE